MQTRSQSDAFTDGAPRTPTAHFPFFERTAQKQCIGGWIVLKRFVSVEEGGKGEEIFGLLYQRNRLER
jgi:hypothetical protein